MFKDITYGAEREKEPKFVNQYMLGEKIGQGSFAKVFEAVDSKTMRRVAIKAMNKRKLRKIKGSMECIKREIRIMKRLNHENIVKLIEVIENDEKEKVYIVMEWLVLGSLQDQIRLNPKGLQIAQVRSYFEQLINGLEYIHNQRVIHRDIKPENLMITADDVLKIVDFGVAEELETFQVSDALSRSLGTPSFQSPQIATGSDTFSGEKIDVWAAGVTLYYLVTGQLPFSGTTVLNLYDNIAKQQYANPKLKEAMDPSLRNLINGMLDPNEETRFSVAQIKKHCWLRGGSQGIAIPASLTVNTAATAASTSAGRLIMQGRGSLGSSPQSILQYLEKAVSAADSETDEDTVSSSPTTTTTTSGSGFGGFGGVLKDAIRGSFTTASASINIPGGGARDRRGSVSLESPLSPRSPSKSRSKISLFNFGFNNNNNNNNFH